MAAAEALWYMSGESDVKAMLPFAPQYIKYAEDDGHANGAYGRRMFRLDFDRLEAAVSALRSDPDSRRVVVPLWHAADLVDGHGPNAKRDVPCTISIHFMIRDSALHMFVHMRSQDVWLGMPYDVFWNCTLMHVIAAELGVAIGTYTHYCDSLHLYDKHRAAAVEAVQRYPMNSDLVWAPVGQTIKGMREAGEKFVKPACMRYGCGLIADELLRVTEAFVIDLPIDNRVLKQAALLYTEKKR